MNKPEYAPNWDPTGSVSPYAPNWDPTGSVSSLCQQNSAYAYAPEAAGLLWEPAALGRPSTKAYVTAFDLGTVAVSIGCLAAGVASVASESLSWRLAPNNNQLILLGFVLSIMNICLGRVAPALFLHIEARFGASTVQNYDGLLRNNVTAARLSHHWRAVLVFLMALPIGLSAAYKQFTGGASTRWFVDPVGLTGTNSTSYYGMFAPPGLQLLGEHTGVSMFFNATQPFTE